jgi:hypothetical protein
MSLSIPKSQICDLCNDLALGKFHLDKGCAAYPSMFSQTLCLHHTVKSQPLGSMELVEDFTLDGSFRAFLHRR